MEIKKFTFWRSWRDQAALLSDEERLAFYDAIVAYAFDGTAPSRNKVPPMVYGFFIGVMPFIDSNVQNTLNGAKGGRPTARSGKSNNPPFTPPKKAEYEKEYEFEFENEDEGGNEKENGVGDVSPSAPSKNSRENRFVPPSENEVAAWLKCEKQLPEREAGRIATCFVSFYESKGWMVGRNRMKSWKAAVAGWLARDRQDTARAQEQTQGMNAGFDLEQYRYRPSATTGQGGGGTIEGLQTHEEVHGLIEMPLAMIQH